MLELVVIPILNKRLSLFQGTPLLFPNGYSIEKISDEEHSAFFRTAPAFVQDSINLKSTRCIKIPVANMDDKVVRNIHTQVTFTLNLFSSSFPIVTAWGGHLGGAANKLTFRGLVEFDSLSSLGNNSANHFKFAPETSRSAILQFFKLLEAAASVNSSLHFSLEKFNSALLRDRFIDKLLDTTICFESLLPGNTELVYRLSQSIAFIVGNSSTERLEIFDKMKVLYDVRSKFVHGDVNEKAEKKMAEVQTDWANYERYLKASISYYILYLSQNKKKDWEQHLKEIIIGTKNKIIS